MKKYPTLLFIIAITVSNIAHATSIGCHGTVSPLLVYKDGSVNIRTSYRGDYTYICNLKTERQGVSITTCATWVGVIGPQEN